MKRIIKSTVASLSMFVLVALYVMPTAAYSPESSVQAAQHASSSVVTANAEFIESVDTPTATNAVLRQLAPAEPASGTPSGKVVNPRVRF